MNKLGIIFIVLLSFAVTPLLAFEPVGQRGHLTPWNFALKEVKPANDLARVLFDSSHSFDAIHYDVSIDVPFVTNAFSGRVRLHGISNEANLGQISLHMMHLVADSAMAASGTHLAYVRTDTTIIINLDRSYQLGDSFAIMVYYHDIAQQRGFYHYARDSYSMAEPYDARWWFPCFDEPWDKATADIHVKVPIGLDVASNGLLESIDTVGNAITYNWRENNLMTTYLLCIGIADYAVWTVKIPDGLGDSLPCIYYLYAEDSLDAIYDFGNVPTMVNIFNNLFGPFPFEKYGMVAVEPFQYGGMEHQTMTTINRTWLDGNRGSEFGIAHELAHQWWGDMVTMSDFRHIWLNEGFATYAEALFAEHFQGPAAYTARIQRCQDYYFYYDQYVGRFPLYDPVLYFNAAEYYKGALVLHMLRGIIGEDDFHAGLLHYASLYRYGNASTSDFRDAMEDISGVDLDYFFHEWIYEQGYPEYQYAWDYSQVGDDYLLNLYIRQVQQNSTIFSMPVQMAVNTPAGETTMTIFNSQQYEIFQISLTDQPLGVQFDPDNWIAKRVQQVSDITDWPQSPRAFELRQNYPNPFNNRTSISFSIVVQDHIRLEIFDITGAQVKILYDGEAEAGDHIVTWNGKDDSDNLVSSGTYLCRLAGSQNSAARKITYLK